MESIKNYFNGHRSEIITGIIVFFITAILSKTIHLLSDVAPVVGFSLIKFLFNIIYRSASEQSENTLISLFFWIVLSGFVAAIVMQAIRSIRLANESMNEMNDALILLEKTKNGEDVDTNEPPKSPIESRINGHIKTSKRLKLMSILLVAMTIIWAFFIVIVSLIPNNIWNRFNRDITMITPYTNQETIDLLKSNWVRMKGQDDYNLIYDVIRSIKTENDLP